MQKLRIGQKVMLKGEYFKKYPSMRKYDILRFSKYGKIIGITKNPDKTIQSCMVQFFNEEKECSILDTPIEFLKTMKSKAKSRSKNYKNKSNLTDSTE